LCENTPSSGVVFPHNFSFSQFPLVLIQLYINTKKCFISRGNWETSKLCENTPTSRCRVSTQFLVFPISTRVDLTVYQRGKCFIFVKYKIPPPNRNVVNRRSYLVWERGLSKRYKVKVILTSSRILPF
jgi:hypothetical protein